MIRDMIGNPLAEGDQVSFGLALGKTAIGTVVRVPNIIAGADPNAPQIVEISFSLSMGVMPNGAVPEIVKIAKAL